MTGTVCVINKKLWEELICSLLRRHGHNRKKTRLTVHLLLRVCFAVRTCLTSRCQATTAGYTGTQTDGKDLLNTPLKWAFKVDLGEGGSQTQQTAWWSHKPLLFFQNMENRLQISPAGNRTPTSRLTSKDTNCNIIENCELGLFYDVSTARM
jgi:hypothetical protein